MGAEGQKTILLVEDEAITAMAEKMALEKYGYTVFTASSGEEAVETIKKTPAIDLILMDINLGDGMDGTEAAALILRQRDMPVVFLSSHMEPEIVEKTEKITSYGYVVKDSSVTVLDASIKMAFKLFAAKLREKEKEEALKEGEERMRAIVEGTPQLFFYIQDAQANTTYVSPTIEDITGYKAETWMKRKDWFITDAAVNQVARERTQEHLRGNFNREPVLLEIRHANGDPLLLEAYEYPIIKDGKVVGLQGVAHDISQRQHAEEELLKRNRYIESILDNMPIGFAVNTIDDGVVRYVNDKFTEIYGWPREVLTDVDRFFENVYPGEYGTELKVRVIRDMGSGDPKRMAWDDLRITTGSGDHRYISARNIPILEQNLMVSTVWDTTRMHESLEALRQSEAKQSNALQMTKSGHWEYDVDRDLFTFNDNFYRIFRTTAAAVGGYQMASEDYARRFCHPDDMAQVGMETRAAIEATDPNYSRQVEHRILYADGEVGWIAVRFFIVKNAQGRTIKTYGVNQDISERKRAEQELRESKSLIDAVVENVPLMIFLKEATDLRFVIFNHAGEELLGYDRSSLLGKNNLDLFPADQAAFFMAKDREVLDGDAGMLDIPEESILTAKKGTRLLHTRKVCIQGADGTKKYLLGVSEDITEHKLMESQREAALMELKVSEARSQALLSTIPDMLFRVNRQGVFLDYKADVKNLYAQAESSIIGKRYRDILPAEFADLIDLKVRAALETGVPQTFKYSLPFPGRGERDYEARMVVSGSDEVTAIIRDISEYDLVEKALRKSELQLKTMLDNSPVVVLLIQEGKLIYINPAAEKFTGWKMEELLGKSFTSVVYKDDVATVIKKNRERMDGENLLAPYMVRINKKTGGFIYAEVNGTVIDLDGKPTMLGFLTDITKRKRAEEEIQRQLEEKEVLLKEVHHRIKNNIASISGLISLQMQTLSNPQAIAILRDAIGRVDNMRLLYDKLLLTENYEDLSVKNYLDNLIDTIVAIFPSPVMIKLEKQIADFHLDAKRLFPLGSIINELLTNIMKYAFDDRKTGLIKISLAKVDHHITLAIQDNGRGLPPGFDFDKAKGFGLMLVKMLSQQLGGSFSMEKRKGTRCTLEFDV